MSDPIENRAGRIDAVLEQPHSSVELKAYRDAVARGASPARFAVRANDTIRLLLRSGDDLALRMTALHLAPAEEKILRWLLENRNESRTLGELASAAGIEIERIVDLVQRGLGSFFTLPILDSLQAEVAAMELCRGPTQPYDLQREYWSNNVDVRRRLARLSDHAADGPALRGFLRQLHVIYLMGETLDSFYVPASAVRSKLSWPDSGPGQIRWGESRCAVESVSLLRYLRHLACALGDRFATSEEVIAQDEDGFLWGRASGTHVVIADKERRVHVYHPATPVLPEHFERLAASLRLACAALRSGNRAALLQQVARFLHRFACLQPFAYGNMGLAMNIVNWFLRQGTGGFVCHGQLDLFAQRLHHESFDELFRRFVKTYWIDPRNPSTQVETVALHRARQRFDDAVSTPDAPFPSEMIQASALVRRALLL